jgi:phage terminase small subunit
MSKPLNLKSDAMLDGRPLRERYEDFCGHIVVSNNPMQAYRVSFAVDKAATGQWVWNQVRELMKDPGILARVQELRDAAASQTIVTVREIIQDLHDIANADPNELVSVLRDACRFCHGIEHKYQWIDDIEYAAACDKALKPGGAVQLPMCDGGFGYRPTNEPNPCCPACFGRGLETQLQRDTTKLSPQARKLYAGIKKGEIQIHDQVRAREMLGRVLGAFKDGIPVTPTAPAPIPKEAQEADASRAYMRLVHGG